VLFLWSCKGFSLHLDTLECNVFFYYYLFLIYSFLQISQLNLTFREIVYNYRKQPHCKPQVFRSVFVDWSLARRNGVCNQWLKFNAYVNFYDNYDLITELNENREQDRIMLTLSPFTMKYLFPQWSLCWLNSTLLEQRQKMTEYLKLLIKMMVLAYLWIYFQWLTWLPLLCQSYDLFIDMCVLHFTGHLAQCPGSPKISSFPTLPDMSPKKVSATHNVYVSPLRSSKVLI